MSRTRPAISPHFAKKVKRKLDWGAPTPPADFPPALSFDASDADVQAWLEFRQTQGNQPVSGDDADWDDDEDEDGAEGGEAASLFSEVDDESEAERVEVSATIIPLRAVEGSSFGAARPRQSTSGSPAKQTLARLLGRLSIGKAKGSKKRDSTPPTLPPSLAIPSRHSATPVKGRSHATSRKFLLAFLHAQDAVHCCISGRVSRVQCAHLVPQATAQSVHLKLEVAIGGRFHLNTRLNYILREWPVPFSFPLVCNLAPSCSATRSP